ncbi:MAG: nucleotidyltransferase family protein [Myxococcota bacterium]
MAVSLIELFRTLTSFSPPRIELRGAPWEQFSEWAVGQGLAPLAAYNLEYRLGAAGVPDWVRDRLLSLYQGSANDNVMKLVNLKRAIDELEGRKIVLVGAASFAESLYPHVAFRPVIDVRLAVPPGDVEPLATWLRRAEFKPLEVKDPAGATRVLSDTRTSIFVHGALLPEADEHRGLLERSLPVRAFGPSARRLDLEDALLVQVALMARAGFEVPMLEFLDLRELVLGSPAMGGPYARAFDLGAVAERAKRWKLERALYCALSIVERLWPETSLAVQKLRPEPGFVTREALERLVIRPLAEVGRMEGFRGEESLRSLLAGD